MTEARGQRISAPMRGAGERQSHGEPRWNAAGKPGVTWHTWAMVAVVWAAAVFVFLFLSNAALAFVAAAIGSAGLLALELRPTQVRRLGETCFRFRWAIALGLFVFCVLLRLHGSSIGAFDQILPTQTVPNPSTLFGEPRHIRSDEFAVATPTYFSQAYNHHALYSQQMSLSPTNMLLDYYSPVWSMEAIGKPLAWGYLFFGNVVGLSWYWCGLQILLFMTALETCLIVTAGQRFVSLLGAVAIALSPEIQWWVMPHMPIVVMYAMGLFCVCYAFFMAKTPAGKWGSAALFVVTAVGFALTLFPSYQVPFAYIVVVLLAACLVRDRRKLVFGRRDWAPLLLGLVAAVAIVAHFFITSAQDIELLLNTVYPGVRELTGGGMALSGLWPNIGCIYFPYKDIKVVNNCEMATYLHLAPFFAVLMVRMAPFVSRERTSNMLVGWTLLALVLAIAFYMVVGIPQAVADITQLRFCNRMHGVYGWTCTLFTVWGVSLAIGRRDVLRKGEKLAYPVLYGVVCFLAIDAVQWDYFSSVVVAGHGVGAALAAAALAFGVATLLFVLFGKRTLLACTIVLVFAVSGATINPLARGAGSITNHPISASISQIASDEPESLWLCTDYNFTLSNFVMANGARVLDATNFYPDVRKWELIDPAGEYAELTNRYANGSATIIEGPTWVELPYPDQVALHLNPQTLQDLQVRYLLSMEDYTELLADYGISCEYIAGQDGFAIYRLDYEAKPHLQQGGE